MDQQLEIYIKKYILHIEEICIYLIKELKLRNKTDLLNYRNKLKKWEFMVGKIRVCFHGRGCNARYNEIIYDWDFGYGSRWCGINPMLLETTLVNKGITFWDFNKIKEQCEISVVEGKMYKKNGLYYFSIHEEDLIKPDFPQMFDMLVVDYFGKSYKIQRNKVVDRFLRKSNRVYKEIEGFYDKYTLRFILNGEEIYKFYYSDICYSEKANELMKSILIDSGVS